jgi:hypothetical protein
VKQLLNAASYFIVIIFLSGLRNRCSEEGGTGDEFMEIRGQWTEKVWEPLLELNKNLSLNLQIGLY